MTYRAGVALIMMLVSITSCGDSEPPEETGGEPEVFFPVHDADDYPSSQGYGVLQEAGGCLLVKEDDAPDELLPVWPEGYSFEEGTLYREDGSIVAAVGERVRLEGGAIEEAVFEDLTGDTVPSSCSDAVPFMVGDAMRDGG